MYTGFTFYKTARRFVGVCRLQKNSTPKQGTSQIRLYGYDYGYVQ